MRRPEQQLQCDLVAYLRLALPHPWLVFHPRNQGEQRSARMHGVFKAMGVLAGIPDLFVIGGPNVYPAHGRGVLAYPTVIAIELKAPPKPLKRGGVSKAKPRTSEAQDAIIAQLGACGVPTLVVRSLDEAIAALKQLGVPLKAQVRG